LLKKGLHATRFSLSWFVVAITLPQLAPRLKIFPHPISKSLNCLATPRNLTLLQGEKPGFLEKPGFWFLTRYCKVGIAEIWKFFLPDNSNAHPTKTNKNFG